MIDSEDSYTDLHYPLFLNLNGKLVTVIGGGPVAERKILTLLDYGARIKVVSPELTEALDLMAETGIVAYEQRTYQKGDLDGAFIVICACGDEETDLLVYREAEELNIPVNVVDVPELCTFIVPSVVRRDPLQIAISTGGNAPVVAKRMRQELEERYPKEFALYIQLMGQVRELVKENVPGGEAERKPLLERLAASDLYEKVKSGVYPSAEEAYRLYIQPQLDERSKEVSE